MIETNTFSSMTISMVDYEMEDHVYEINYEEFRLVREACDEVTAQDPKTFAYWIIHSLGRISNSP